MPELPEVEVTRRGLAPRLVGQRIGPVEVREARLRWRVPATVRALSGRTVRAVRLRDPRRFGAVLWTADPPGEHPLLRHLGVEPLSRALDARHLHALARPSGVSIKTLLMDGRRVVGVGNIYASESLFLARIDPRKRANRISLEKCAKLVAAIKTTLKAAIRAGGSTLRDFVGSDGAEGYFQRRAWVYGREGEPCRRCGTRIKRLVQGQRATYFCPACQA